MEMEMEMSYEKEKIPRRLLCGKVQRGSDIEIIRQPTFTG